MKKSNILLTFILAFLIAITVEGQSKSNRVISVDNDDEKVHIEYTDGEVTLLKIDGKTIDKKDYPSYQNIIDKYANDSALPAPPSPPTPPTPPVPRGEDAQDDKDLLLERITLFLAEKELINTSKYKFKLTTKSFKVNGKKVEDYFHTEGLQIFKNTMGNEMTKDSYFDVDISSGSKSVSLSIVD